MATVATDSLLSELKNTPQNKEKTLLLSELSKSFKESNLDSSFFFAKEGLDLAAEIDYSLGIAENAASLADYYIMNDNLNTAKEYYLLAAKHFEALDMKFDHAQILMILGNIYLSQSNHSEALLYYQKSQNICEENDFNTILPHIYNNTGLIYSYLEENDKALDQYKKAYSGFKGLDLKENIANVVSNIAALLLSINQDSLALSYYEEALNLFKQTGNTVDASIVYIELGDYAFDNEDLSKALAYYEKAMEQAQLLGSEYLGPRSAAIANILGKLGRVHFHIGNRQQALVYLNESLILAKSNNYLHIIEFSANQLSELYESYGEYEKALEFYKIYEQYDDSLLNESTIKRITELEMQYGFDQHLKERALEGARKETIQQRKEFMYILSISLFIFLAIIAFLMYLNQRNKNTKIELKRQNLNLEHDKLQQELEYRNRELATNLMYLLSKNEFITITAEKLAKAKMSFKKENQKTIQDIIRDLLLNSSKDVWKEFEVRFQEVHSEFYDNLNKSYPDLTPNEKKICAFLRLNMSTKDISAITYQSVRSIEMARFRLRKKLKLDTDDNLVTMLAQL